MNTDSEFFDHTNDPFLDDNYDLAEEWRDDLIGRVVVYALMAAAFAGVGGIAWGVWSVAQWVA